MVHPARTSSRTTRKLTVSALAAAITLALGAPHAQVRVEAQSTEIRGRAPVATIGSVDNETVAGQAPAVGHTLKAHATVVDPDDDAITGTTYKWKRGATEVGTGEEYATTAADAGQTLTVEVTATTDAAITDPAIGSATREVAVSANTAPTVEAGGVSITGTYSVGQDLTGHWEYRDVDGDLQDEDGVQLQWQISHPTTGAPTNIPGATGRTYRIRPEDQGANRKIWFSVEKVKSLTGTPNERLRPTSPAGQWQASRQGLIDGNAPVAAPTITGTLKTHQVLTGNVNYADAEGDGQGVHQYKWYTATDAAGTNRTLISGATSNTYTLTGAEQGKYVVFEVTPVSVKVPTTGIAYRAVSALVAGTAPTVEAGGVSITGTYSVGQDLTGHWEYRDADGDLQDEDGVQLQWQISHPTTGAPTNIPGATGRTYRIKPEDQGANRRIWFSVEKVKSQTGTPNERLRPTSPAGQWQASREGMIGGIPVANPVVSGDADWGQTMTVDAGYSYPGGPGAGTHTYQWYRADSEAGANKVAISGATGASYTLQKTVDEGKFIGVSVTPRASNGVTGVAAFDFAGTRSRYRLQGSFVVTSSGNTHISLPISNQSGNAPSALKVGIWRTYDGQDHKKLKTTLIAPNGTRFTVNGPNEGSSAFTTVNASGSTFNGTWTLEIGPVDDFGTPTHAIVAIFTLEF